MLKIIIVILALVVTPFIFGNLFQKKKFNSDLQPTLLKKAENILSESGVNNGSVSLDRLDAKLYGTANSVEEKKAVQKKVNKLAGVRAKTSDNFIKVASEFKITKTGDRLTSTGTVLEASKLNELTQSLSSLEHNKTGLEESSTVVDSPLVGNANFSQWSNDFLNTSGDRSYEVKGNEITLTGTATAPMAAKWNAALEAQNLNVNSQLEIVEPKEGEISLQKVNGQILFDGEIPKNYPKEKLNYDSAGKVENSDFVALNKSADSAPFFDWVQSYFSPVGDRRLDLKGDQLTLSGVATPLLWNNWSREIGNFKFGKVENNLSLYPSEYHYPGYKLESDLTAEEYRTFSAQLKALPIYFDLGQSQVKESEIEKVDKLTTLINSQNKSLKFLIGGHTDPSGNREINERLSNSRAQQVINQLSQRGVDANRFSIITFGATKSQGNAALDRRVELLIK